jgi:hypothetical protein
VEPVDEPFRRFYDQLLGALRDPTVRDGEWRLLECVPAWDGNGTWDGFICFGWRGPDGRRALVTVNYASNQGQCYVRLPFDELRGKSVRLRDRMSAAVYDRSGDDLLARGLYLDLPSFGHHIFEVSGAS